jgi:CxxC-x17-CxxC domain-containing protein
MLDEEVKVGAAPEQDFKDETLVCKECGAEFVFTAGEQRFYAQKGFQNKPKACKACRDAKKNAGKAPREYYTTVCAQCGGEARVTFQPSNDRPVYCSACFEARKKAQQ